MLSKILWSIVLANLLCAASYLDHFTKVPIYQCAERCFLEKFFCSAFVVYDTQCRTSATLLPRDSFSPGSLIGAIYNIKEPRRFDVVEEFSRHIESSREWIDHVKKGYSESVQKISYEPFLLGCWNSAVNGKPAVVVDIIEQRVTGDFIEDNDTGERKAKRRKLSQDSIDEEIDSIDEISVGRTIPGHSITEEIAVGLKSWPQSLEFSDIIALAFLDIFSHNIGRDYTTVFDPIKKSLFIHGHDFYLFIVSYGNGDYVMIHYHSRLYGNRPLIYTSGSELPIQYQSAMKMFEGAMNGQTFISGRVINININEDDGGDTGSVLAMLSGATILLLLERRELGPRMYAFLPDDSRKCLTDMVLFVLSKVYGKNIRSQITQSGLLKSSLETHFTDIGIITVPRSDPGIGNGT